MDKANRKIVSVDKAIVELEGTNQALLNFKDSIKKCTYNITELLTKAKKSCKI